jgi:tRNA (guanine-N7-)-methyltransferase
MLLYPRHLFLDPTFLAQGWQAWLPGEGPLNLEIGCGYGHFLSYMATRFPEQRFIGLDIINKILLQVDRRLQRDGLANARVCKLDAVVALRELFPRGSLANIYILFPDPWFKERRLKRRILRSETLPELLRVLKPGGCLHFVSDDTDYAADALQLLEACSRLQAVPFPDLETRTKYERKWLEQDKTIHRYAYQLVEGPEPALWPGYDSRAAIVLRDWTADKGLLFWQNFQPLKALNPNQVLKFLACYRSGESLLLKGLLADTGSLALEFWVEIDPQGQLTLAPHSCLPRLQNRARLLTELADLIQRGISHGQG